ncbi:dipeptidase [Bacillus massiliglaciei]|uniref:dipeptidase n=1 Tax=Bacillus massiliglaciei TaxID=1816693 RepID=UPI000A934E9C|nr:dipeptidase [Bacillus massiliglaciei]
MRIFDAHCDALMKLFMDPAASFNDSENLHITKKELKETGGKVQCFAIYIPEKVHPGMRFSSALAMVDLFYEKILNEPEMKMVRTKSDIESLREGEIGAVLTLEGCDCIGDDIVKLKTLIRLGVASVGLTWNYGNMVADGALEPRGGGLTQFGREAVAVLNKEHVWCDVSHLSESAFWDTVEDAHFPIASHSNAYQLCEHPRNLKDEQIKALIQKNGTIGVTFVPKFLHPSGQAAIKDILLHVEHICSLGGQDHVGFGSDFDGIEQTVQGMTAFRGYTALGEELLKFYPEKLVRNLLFHNFVKAFPR